MFRDFNKLYLHKQSYGIQLWRSTQLSNMNKIQTFQTKNLCQITKTPYNISNRTLYSNSSKSFQNFFQTLPL